MRHRGIGIAAGLASFLGSALAAHAQIKIEGTKPTAVYHTQSQSTYEATVTWTGSFNWRLRVYLGTVEKWPGVNRMGSSPGPSVQVTETVTGMDTWGMQPGNTLKYRGKAWTNLTNQNTHDLILTVQEGTTHLIPQQKLPPGRGEREELYAVLVRREEREWA